MRTTERIYIENTTHEGRTYSESNVRSISFLLSPTQELALQSGLQSWLAPCRSACPVWGHTAFTFPHHHSFLSRWVSSTAHHPRAPSQPAEQSRSSLPLAARGRGGCLDPCPPPALFAQRWTCCAKRDSPVQQTRFNVRIMVLLSCLAFKGPQTTPVPVLN